jgi:hypothetical protein
MKAGGLIVMNMGRKGAMVLLAVVVLWAAMPAFACLIDANQMSQSECCRAMANCDPTAMAADSPCCQIHERTPAVPPVQPFSPVKSLEIAALPHESGIVVTAELGGAYGNTLETPPPKFPPGGAFSLRI